MFSNNECSAENSMTLREASRSVIRLRIPSDMLVIWITPILPHSLATSSSTITVKAINRDLEEENVRSALRKAGRQHVKTGPVASKLGHVVLWWTPPPLRRCSLDTLSFLWDCIKSAWMRHYENAIDAEGEIIFSLRWLLKRICLT